MAREKKFSTEDLFQATNHLLLQHGYEGFTFSILADHLNVSRGALYKYYENKEELITDFMLYEMNLFLVELREIDHVDGFEEQFEFLIQLIFKNKSIHKLIEIGSSIPTNVSAKAKENRDKLDLLHLEMYKNLQGFIELGKKERMLKEDIPNGLLLGIIFQSIAIPNHFGVPYSIWVESIKEILSHGMFKKR
ncbi:TetR/AcrR family transcriptional regulator [Sutcliffiella cohnii]|uniref:TetR family transcriptional regulator n=1 Tax=Sutcliffiella cohnii TaxID=33932 RepID=A0A223KLG5_9BACI|nr:MULTISPECIES: TetR/AcrR family transcriptional regulator [Sutcliffiella]AST90204.1 TetR family transcriptional regulator [Sutcliffiella cohnii]WBL15854.1 TetR/AcrR family transcriptional regulator [Sutcliffiella sp. NC1]